MVAEFIAVAVAGERVSELVPEDVTLEQWISARIILVEEDTADYLADDRDDLLHRGGVVLIAHHQPTSQRTWNRAQRIAASWVAFLPEATELLVREIRAAIHGRHSV
jgi:hypothetical protein